MGPRSNNFNSVQTNNNNNNQVISNLKDIKRHKKDSHGNNIETNESNTINTNKKKRGSKVSRHANKVKPVVERSQSFHIKCDRTYTKYYQIEYKGEDSKVDPKLTNENDTIPPRKSELLSSANFDSSEEYFVDDDDDDELQSTSIQHKDIRKQRSSSLEPVDYLSMHIPTVSSLNRDFTSTLNREFCNGDSKTDSKNNANDDEQRQTKLSLDYSHSYIVENQQTPKCRPSIQR